MQSIIPGKYSHVLHPCSSVNKSWINFCFMQYFSYRYLTNAPFFMTKHDKVVCILLLPPNYFMWFWSCSFKYMFYFNFTSKLGSVPIVEFKILIFNMWVQIFIGYEFQRIFVLCYMVKLIVDFQLFKRAQIYYYSFNR